MMPTTKPTTTQLLAACRARGFAVRTASDMLDHTADNVVGPSMARYRGVADVADGQTLDTKGTDDGFIAPQDVDATITRWRGDCATQRPPGGTMA